MIRRKRYFVILAISLSAFMALLVFRLSTFNNQPLLVEAIIVFITCWLMLRFILAHFSRTYQGKPPNLRVSIVIPLYNEDPEIFKLTLGAIAKQTRVPERVWIIDDGSKVLDDFYFAKSWASEMTEKGIIDVRVHRFSENRGKRFAQAIAFKNDDDAEIFITLDSDTVMEKSAIKECLKPFKDKQVYGVAGLIIGYNWNRSIFTRIVDLDFVNTFLIGRAAMGKLESVLVACGCMAAYRAEVCREHVNEYLNETFLGSPVRNGDDRKMTQYSLLRGKVVFQETCISRTMLPETLSHLIRQRTRWFTSFYRGTFWMLVNMPFNRVPFWLTVLHVTTFIFEIGLILFAAILAIKIDLFLVIGGYLMYIGAFSYIRNIRYLNLHRIDMCNRDQLSIFMLSPLVSLLYTFILLPVRYLAFFKLRSSNWRTRKKIEVKLERYSLTDER